MKTIKTIITISIILISFTIRAQTYVIAGAKGIDSTVMNIFKYKAYLYNADSLPSSPIDSLDKDDASPTPYQFNNVKNGRYFILLAPDTTLYPNTIPTYYGDTYKWEEADTILINNTNSLDNIIYVISVDIPLGGSIISGEILEGNFKPNKTEGDPIPGVDIVLEQVPGGVIRGRSKTNEKGEFQFNNIEIGSYKLYVNIIGIPNDTTFLVNIINDNQEKTITGIVDSTLISFSEIVSINNHLNNNDIKIYPNPFNEVINIQSNNFTKFELYNLQGTRIFSSSNKLVTIPKKINSGLYIYKLLDSKNVFMSGKLIKK